MSTRVISSFLFLLIISCVKLVSCMQITEIELNPAGTDNGNEWLELYSNYEESGYYIENVKNVRLDIEIFEGYKVLATPRNFLTNEKQKLILYNSQGEKIQETSEISDTSNDERTWQLCSEWEFLDSSKGEKNKCENENNVDNEENEEEDKVENEEVEKNVEDLVEKVSVNTENKAEVDNTLITTGEVIKLEPKDIKTWKSSTSYIKEYSLIGFSLFCLVILIWLIKHGKNKSNNDF